MIFFNTLLTKLHSNCNPPQLLHSFYTFKCGVLPRNSTYHIGGFIEPKVPYQGTIGKFLL